MHLDQVLPTMEASLKRDLGKPIVHIIDREWTRSCIIASGTRPVTSF